MNTLDKLIRYYEQSTESQKISQKISGINNFNNVETSDRKLIINNKLEFWVHDKILNDNCTYFLTLNKNENHNQNKDSAITENIKKRVKSSLHNGNHNLELNLEIIDKNKKDKIHNVLQKEKRNIYTKKNSKDFNAKNHKKIKSQNDGTYNTVSLTERNGNSNHLNDIKKTWIKKRKCYLRINKRNEKKYLNKSSITADLSKIKTLMKGIKEKKRTLGLINTTKYSTNKRIDDNNYKRKELKIGKNHHYYHIKRNANGGEKFFYEKKYINTISNTNINKKITCTKSFLDKNPIVHNNKKLSIDKNRNKMKMNLSDINNKTKVNNKSDKNINTVNNVYKDSNSFIKITKIYIDDINEYELFFDLLLWMYTKDISKLKKITKNFKNLINILSLSNFLGMKKEFYNLLLTPIHKNFDINFFKAKFWTKSKISFYALEKIVPLLNENYIRIYALISWLKPINKNTKQISDNDKLIKESLHSKEFFLVRNYIKKYKLLYSLTKEELIELKNKFSHFIDCLDMEGIFDNYILSSQKLECIRCNNKFVSLYQIIGEKEKDNEKYDEQNDNNINKDDFISYKKMNGLYRTTKLKNNKLKISSDMNQANKYQCKHLLYISNE